MKINGYVNAGLLWTVCIALCFLFLGCNTDAQSAAPEKVIVLNPLDTVRQLAALNKGFADSALQIDAPVGEIQALRKRGQVVFSMTAADQKPFFYREEKSGEFIGLDVELGYAIANSLGVRAVFNREASSFDDVVQKVINKEADIALSKLSRTMRRAELVRYTIPYITFRQALLVNRLELVKVSSEDRLPSFIKNYRGRLGVIKNSSYVSYAQSNFPGAAIEAYDSWDDTVEALFTGAVLAAYRDEGEILIVNTTRPDASILMKPVFISDKQDPIAMAVSADAPLLQEWLNLFLEDYLFLNKTELTPAHIVERHFGETN
ncbi:substrate-binding periplasmic protein [Breznakiellaceae bacterium SP9]